MRDIEIYFWEGYISVAPTVINLANGLAEKGHSVKIYTRNIQGYAPDPQLHDNVELVRINTNRLIHYFDRIVMRIPIVNSLQKEIISFKFLITFFNLIIKKRRAKNNNILLIAIDTIGLYWANSIKKTHDPLVYLSLELTIPTEWFNENFIKYLKNNERKIHNNAVTLTIIQDHYRQDLLKKANQIPHDSSFAILTNSPRKVDFKHELNKNFFEEHFYLPKGCFKILSAGMISEAVLSTDIATCFNKFSDKTVYMIFHERDNANRESEYLQEIQRVGGKNLILSLNPLAYDEIYKVFTAADIGLVFYNPNYGENFSNIIGASGKLAHYLKFGMPVICLDLPGFQQLIDKYKCGVVIKQISQLENAVNEVKLNYSSMKKGALNCYDECYNFDYQLNTIYSNWEKLFKI